MSALIVNGMKHICSDARNMLTLKLGMISLASIKC